MTTSENKPSSEERVLKIDPESTADLDPENEATDTKGGVGVPRKNANGLKNC
jgi:hypothetical protein